MPSDIQEHLISTSNYGSVVSESERIKITVEAERMLHLNHNERFYFALRHTHRTRRIPIITNDEVTIVHKSDLYGDWNIETIDSKNY
ncbi:hypothetical protein B1F79_01710 [Coxiella-like endosymbiont of Rhipicephalus sanguineus]|uniref:hypothetical protein n=1 Tax=Coxiella-like endosymbiont of Rhipicephalus sanguineus TaxID=1955402 RepID=UPI0020419A69|nr:hypothetical protein [Coxiella-like endosymbiont of Rhipicephalus sanguineus]MBT8506385.1 hypothetical protein [Coxiella-like endosymbiont of Rhipicephalus sanguineus]